MSAKLTPKRLESLDESQAGERDKAAIPGPGHQARKSQAPMADQPKKPAIRVAHAARVFVDADGNLNWQMLDENHEPFAEIKWDLEQSSAVTARLQFCQEQIAAFVVEGDGLGAPRSLQMMASALLPKSYANH